MCALIGVGLYEELRTVEQLRSFCGLQKRHNAKLRDHREQKIAQKFLMNVSRRLKQEYKKQSISEEKFSSFVASEISRLAPYKTLTDESAYWSIED